MKLRLLTPLSKENVDYTTILREYLGVKKVRWYQAFYFIKLVKEIQKESEEIRKLDPKSVEENPDCKILRPESIDEIAFGAMVELHTLFQNPGERDITELIIETISLSCFESHTKKPFDSDSQDFKKFRILVSDSDLIHMLGLYGWIDRTVNSSVDKWNKLFLQVQVHDQDYDNAGGKMMEKFDVLNTIKNTCSDLNLDYFRAIQLPNGLVKSLSLSRATQAYVQEQMRIIIEARFKSKNQSLGQ